MCLDTMLRYEGVIRNVEYLLSMGKNVYTILEENLDNVEVLDLKGCSLDAMLYYVNQDIPVMVPLQDGNAVLITGFNQYNIVVLDPQKGTLEKVGMKDAALWFEENGNAFITYKK